MHKFTSLTAVAAPMDASNIDTDQIIPKQFLLAVDRKGFGKHLFHNWRYLDEAENMPNPDFILNKPCYQKAQFIVARHNFGNVLFHHIIRVVHKVGVADVLDDFQRRHTFKPYLGLQVHVLLDYPAIEFGASVIKVHKLSAFHIGDRLIP